MENPEGSAGKTDQDLKKLESSVQSCRFARPGPSDGRPHIKTLQSPAPLLGGQVTPLSSQTATQSDLVASDGQVVWTNAGVQAALEEFSEDGNVMADQSPYVAPSVPGVVSLDA